MDIKHPIHCTLHMLLHYCETLMSAKQAINDKLQGSVAKHLRCGGIVCETLMSAKQAINDKLQGSVATHLRCGGIVNKQIKKSLLPSLGVKKN